MATRLPRAIQRQVEAAEAILTGGNNPPAAQEPAASPAPQEPPPVVEPQTQQLTEPVAPAPAPSPAPVPPAPTEVDWEKKYKTLQGIFNAEMPKLQHATKDKDATIAALSAEVEKLKNTSPAPEPQRLDTKDVDSFGADLVEMVHRQVKAMLGPVVERVNADVVDFKARLTSVEQRLEGTTKVVATTAEDAFFSRLTALVPNWSAINQDQRFLDWLAEIDPIYGATRQAALDAAQGALDANRVANVFNAFAPQLTKQDPPKTSPLEKQTAPKAVASATPVPTEKPVYTQQQVTEFYHAVATGKYRGREAEAAQVEQLINQALAEGRIR